MHAFLGRLAARFAPSIAAINIQFPVPIQSSNRAVLKGRTARMARRKS
jgi:hypothetical protein